MVPQANLKAVLTCYQAELIPVPPPHTPAKTFVQVYLLQESELELGKSKKLRNLGINIQVTFQDITNKNRRCMKTPTTEAQRVIFKYNTLFDLCCYLYK